MTETLREAGFLPARPEGLPATVVADSRAQWFVLAETENMDRASLSGRWLKTTGAVEVLP